MFNLRHKGSTAAIAQPKQEQELLSWLLSQVMVEQPAYLWKLSPAKEKKKRVKSEWMGIHLTIVLQCQNLLPR